MTTKLEGGEGSASRPGGSLPPGKMRYPLYRSWVGPRASLDRCGKARLTGVRSPGRPARSQSLCRLNYPDHDRPNKRSLLINEHKGATSIKIKLIDKTLLCHPKIWGCKGGEDSYWGFLCMMSCILVTTLKIGAVFSTKMFLRVYRNR
jgi:hypothetical protein